MPCGPLTGEAAPDVWVVTEGRSNVVTQINDRLAIVQFTILDCSDEGLPGNRVERQYYTPLWVFRISHNSTAIRLLPDLDAITAT
jgi:hypothetical protein